LKYRVLNKQNFKYKGYSLVPIRFEDRYKIMQWRNEQLYHLRQKEPLTKETQDKYFNTVIAGLFDQEHPEQILFSYLEGDECIGYGGLVHIDWQSRNAEISFLSSTELDGPKFDVYWKFFLNLIEQVAFRELALHKIYTYAFNVRPKLYPILLDSGYNLDAQLKEHVLINNRYYDVLIHYKIQADG
jgi:RimJ/RimL family protein N-acetyltransferase